MRLILGFLSLVAVVGAAQCLSTAEALALRDLALSIPALASISPIPWDPSNSSAACDNAWTGLFCVDNGVVTIDLEGRGLEGTLPNSIGNLTNLQRLALESNRLTHTIPTSLGNIVGLELISLSNNILSGTIPATLGVNQPLKEVYMRGNLLNGTIPAALGSQNIVYIYLGDNLLRGTIPQTFGTASNLREFDVGENRLLEGPLPSFRPSLQELYVGNNRLNGTLPDFGSLPNLVQFFGSNNLFSGTISPLFSTLRSLRSVGFSNNSIEGSLPPSLPPALLDADFARNKLNGTIPNGFFTSRNLTSLSMDRNLLSGTIPVTIGNLTSLNYLYLGVNLLQGAIPRSLWLSSSLLEIALDSNNLTGCFVQPPSTLSGSCEVGNAPLACSCNVSQCGLAVCSSNCMPDGACLLGQLGEPCFRNSECESNYCSASLECAPLPSPTATPSSASPSPSQPAPSGNIPTIQPVPPTLSSNLDAPIEVNNSTGVIVAIVVVCVVAFLAATVVAVVLLRRRNQRRLDSRTRSIPSKEAELDSSQSHYLGSAALSASGPGSSKWQHDFTSGLRAEWLIPFSDLAFESELGVGTFGKVWKGKLRQVTKVAIKQALLPGKQEHDLAAFRKEAELMLRLPPHPNVVQVLGVSSQEDSVYIVMELCPGGSVESSLRSGSLDEKLKLKILVGLARAMQHLHAHNICHRDIAARNILLGPGDVPKLTDFGMSRVVQSEHSQSSTMTDVGPVRWMAPESIQSLAYSTASDVWTFGATITEIWTNQQPYASISNILEVARRVGDGEAPAIPSGIPAFLAEAIQRCCVVDPSRRPTSTEICHLLLQHIED